MVTRFNGFEEDSLRPSWTVLAEVPTPDKSVHFPVLAAKVVRLAQKPVWASPAGPVTVLWSQGRTRAAVKTSTFAADLYIAVAQQPRLFVSLAHHRSWRPRLELP